MQPPSLTMATQKPESRRRHLVTSIRTSNASPHNTVQDAAAAAPATSSTKPNLNRTHAFAQQHSSSARRETLSNSLSALSTAVAAAPTGKESSGRGSMPTAYSIRPKSPIKSATYPRTHLSSSLRTPTKSSRAPVLTMLDLSAASSQPNSKPSPPSHTEKMTASAATAGVPKQSTMRVSSFMIDQSSTSPPSGPSTGGSPPSPYSPYTSSPTNNWYLCQTTPFGPNALIVYEPCDLFDLHHALHHRLVDTLGWSLHWCLDTESAIQQLELAKELKDKAQVREVNTAYEKNAAAADGVKDTTDETSAASVKNPVQACGSAGATLAESGPAVTPRCGDSTTPQNYRMDAHGRQLPHTKQKSQFGVMSNRFECPLCHELTAVRRSAFALTPRSRLSRSPYEFRLASLRRWLRKRSTESPSDALLASCLSVEVQRYLAYVGFADCWTSLFVTVGLPVIHPIPTNAASTAAREKARRFPTTLAASASFDRVPLSFYVLPALCRWRTLTPTRVEELLRTALVHPFSLSMSFPHVAHGTADKATARMKSPISSIAASLTFFTIQEQSYPSSIQRSSSQRNLMASLGEACVCDVYLLASNTPSFLPSSSTAADGSAEAATAVASVWGYVQNDLERKIRRSTDGAKHASGQPQTGEIFYIASSLENYLRMGIVFGWVYGWQMCFSTAGPPPNSVPWLQWINASAYRAALAANSDTAP